MPQHITVSDYNAEWPIKFYRESQAISAILTDNCIEIYHIGSTSVNGLSAKPIIDIMAVVKNLGAVDYTRDKFSALGYEWLGEFGMAGRRYLRKGGDNRTHQIHIFAADDWHNIHRHLAFRDYLRAHGDVCRRYEALKRSLAAKFAYDIEGYCEGKDAFVKHIEELAVDEFDEAWEHLYIGARKVLQPRVVSKFIEAGSVAAALMTDRGNMYTGVCIDAACSLGMCAERNAVGSMITNGEHTISKLVIVAADGRLLMPCGACRENMMQLCGEEGDIKILKERDGYTVVGLKSLLPEWWA